MDEGGGRRQIAGHITARVPCEPRNRDCHVSRDEAFVRKVSQHPGRRMRCYSAGKVPSLLCPGLQWSGAPSEAGKVTLEALCDLNAKADLAAGYAFLPNRFALANSPGLFPVLGRRPCS